MTLEVRCIDCWERWDPDMEPAACVCDDGGRWQIRESGAHWSEAVDSEGQEA